ncbi:MAG: hypothetical protein IPF42_17715 [Candidatus Microthrix sp.]|nr:hypothetical protein [Candidatus Microthrix sp.]
MTRDDGSGLEGARFARLGARLRYRMDNLLSRGVWAVLLWLGAATAVVVLISSLLLTVFGLTFADSENTSWIEDVWQSLLRTLDTGTMAADTGWGPRALALIVTLAGILLAGTLIGLIASGVEQRVQQMQRGKSTVVESGHIVILGTSSRLPKLIEQLAIAGRDRARNVIVVLADCEPRELREAVGTNRARLHGSHLVIRSGLTDRVSDLSMVRVREARAVIVVAEDDAENDTDVVKAVLAVGSAAGGFGRKPIIAELREVAMAERLARACGDSVHPIVTTVAIARLTSFMLRDPGMADVVDELMDASGGGIDLIDASDVVGLPFGEIVRRFHGMRPIGLIGDDGTVRLNPDARSVPGSRRPPGDDSRSRGPTDGGNRAVRRRGAAATIGPGWTRRPAARGAPGGRRVERSGGDAGRLGRRGQLPRLVGRDRVRPRPLRRRRDRGADLDRAEHRPDAQPSSLVGAQRRRGCEGDLHRAARLRPRAERRGGGQPDAVGAHAPAQGAAEPPRATTQGHRGAARR